MTAIFFTKEIVGGSLILFFKLLKLERAFLKMKLLLFLNEFFYLPKEGVFYATYAIFYTTIMYWGMHYYMLGNINKMHS